MKSEVNENIEKNINVLVILPMLSIAGLAPLNATTPLRIELLSWNRIKLGEIMSFRASAAIRKVVLSNSNK